MKMATLRVGIVGLFLITGTSGMANDCKQTLFKNFKAQLVALSNNNGDIDEFEKTGGAARKAYFALKTLDRVVHRCSRETKNACLNPGLISWYNVSSTAEIDYVSVQTGSHMELQSRKDPGGGMEANVPVTVYSYSRGIRVTDAWTAEKVLDCLIEATE